MPASTSKINFKIIDWMRGLAALYVVFNHSRGLLFSSTEIYSRYVTPKSQWGLWEWANIIMMQHTNLGEEFVILFFILSGFSIANSLDHSTEPGKFFLRRFVRLYPPYVLGIIWALFVFLVVKWIASDIFYKMEEGHSPMLLEYYKFYTLKTMLLNLSYIPSNNYLTPQYWSLPFEIIFYFIIPFFFKRIRVYAIVAISMYFLSWFIHGIYIIDDGVANTFYKFFVDFNLFFLIGIAFYKYRDILITTFPLTKKQSIILLILIFEIQVIGKSYLFHQTSTKLSYLLQGFFAYVLVFSSLKYNIRNAILERIGSFSYTLYVSHFASIFLVKVMLFRLGYHFYEINLIFAWYFGIIVSVFFAYGLYFLAEYPSIMLLRRMRSEPIKFFRWKTKRWKTKRAF